MRLIANIETKGPDFLQNGFFSEDVAGDYLFILGKGYFGQVGIMDEIASSYFHLPFFKDICSANLFVEADVNYIFGMPYTMSIRGLSIDADRNICLVVGKQDKVRDFMTLSGYTSSVLEHSIWEKWYGEGAISAIKAIQIANENGISVYDIDSSNVNIVDGFNIPSLAKQNIKNAINAGNIAKCPQSSITYKGWQGVGYIISDPTTGEGRYVIADVSGGIILVTNPSGKDYQKLYNIEVEAIRYARNNLTNPDGTPKGDDCEAFANFTQKLASLWDELPIPMPLILRKNYFLCSLYDLSVSDDWYYYIFGLLGHAGPRKWRPKWLNTHDEGEYDKETHTILYTGGYRIYDPKDPDMAGAVTGKKDHFVTNAVEPDLAEIIEEWSWVVRRKEKSTNDLKYNALGREFGNEIRSCELSFSMVRWWIWTHLHEQK